MVGLSNRFIEVVFMCFWFVFGAVFSDMWQSLTLDISSICKEVMERQKVPEKQTYMSLPRPGVSIEKYRLYLRRI